MRRNYDYGGSVELRVDAIDVEVRKPYFNSPGGLISAYIEQHQTLMAELNIIAPKEYTDDRKQRLLLKNVRRAPGMAHLTHHCEYSNLSYDSSSSFLLQNALILEHDIATHTPERATETETDDGILVSSGYIVDTSHEEPVMVHAHFEYATPTTCLLYTSDAADE